MRTKKIQATNDIVEYEKLEFETEQKIEEQETEQEKEKEEQEIEQKNENPTLPGDVEFFITRGVVYILDDYLKLFGKPKK
jgi:hypothetical protein